MKKNCWEEKKCGREVGGDKVAELGVCPSATDDAVNGVNSGRNGGRSCWVVAGTFCGGAVQGSYVSKLLNCIKCDFYKQVMREEGADYMGSEQIMKLKSL